MPKSDPFDFFSLNDQPEKSKEQIDAAKVVGRAFVTTFDTPDGKLVIRTLRNWWGLDQRRREMEDRAPNHIERSTLMAAFAEIQYWIEKGRDSSNVV